MPDEGPVGKAFLLEYGNGVFDSIPAVDGDRHAKFPGESQLQAEGLLLLVVRRALRNGARVVEAYLAYGPDAGM